MYYVTIDLTYLQVCKIYDVTGKIHPPQYSRSTVLNCLDAVIISPPILVAAVNNSRSTTFTCLSLFGLNEGGIASIRWLLNGVFLEDLNLNNVNQTFVSDGGGFGTLIFSRVQLDQNSTFLSCTVNFMSGRVETSSDSLLLVQGWLIVAFNIELNTIMLIIIMYMHTLGLLSTVNDLSITVSNSTLSLTWEPPFSLDITGVNPDITGYCVDMVDFTSSTILLSQCGIKETEYSYLLPQDAVCHSYVLTIIPVNVVGRGISSSVLYIGTEAGTCMFRPSISSYH